MKKFFIPLFAALLSCSAFAADAPTLAGMPMKHSMAAQMQCSTCHDNTTEFTKPSTQKCESCHGPMAQIKTKANPQDKYPHQSAHYGNTVDCGVCHSEHKASQDLCSNCHQTQWTNFR